MRRPNILTIAAPAVLVAAALYATGATADETVTPLLKTPLSGLDGMEANIALIEVDPGFQTERHLHPGHVFLYVIEGAIEIDAEGADPVRIGAGEVAYELPNQVMIGRNVSATDGARFVLFQVGRAGEPMTVAQ